MTTPDTRTAPGHSLSVKADLAGEGDPSLARTLYTSRAPFSVVEGLLSEKPLRRPNRTRPIETLEDNIDRQAIQERADESSVSWGKLKDELGL